MFGLQVGVQLDVGDEAVVDIVRNDAEAYVERKHGAELGVGIGV